MPFPEPTWRYAAEALPEPPKATIPARPAGAWNESDRHYTPDTLALEVHGPGWDVLGRDGNFASAAQIEATLLTLNQTPNTHPLGSWIAQHDYPSTPGRLHWGQYIGLGGGRSKDNAHVLIEFRTPEEVDTAAGVPNTFAYTTAQYNLGDPLPAGLPLLDGRGSNTGSPYTVAAWGADHGVLRILVRNDLDTGGAGPEWAGQRFLAESINHELGHALVEHLMQMYGEDYVKTQACAIFERPIGDWNPLDQPWTHRVLESVCETIKDVMMPGRRYMNRTNLRVPRANWSRFLDLFVGFIENPFWENRDLQSIFIFQAGTTQPPPAPTEVYYAGDVPPGDPNNPVQPSYLFISEEHWPTWRAAAWSGSLSLFKDYRALSWPPEGDVLRLRYNFLIPPWSPPWEEEANLDEEGNLPGGVSESIFKDWPDFATSAYAWDSASPPSVKLGFAFWTPESAFAPGFGALVPPAGSALLGEVARDVSPASDSGVGEVALTISDLPFSVPDTGVLVTVTRLGEDPWGTLPQPDLWRYEDRPPNGVGWHSDGPAAANKPWVEAFNIKRVRYRRDFLYPYRSTTLTLGQVQPGRIVLPHRVRGRRLRIL